MTAHAAGITVLAGSDILTLRAALP